MSRVGGSSVMLVTARKVCSRATDQAGLVSERCPPEGPACHHSPLLDQLPSTELLGAAVFQGQKPPRAMVVAWRVSGQASLLLFIVRVCNFTSKGQCRSRQCHMSRPSGRNVAQDGALLASLSGKEGRGRWVRAARQPGTVWGSQREGSPLLPKRGSSSPVCSSPKSRDQKANIPCNPSEGEGGTLSGSH